MTAPADDDALLRHMQPETGDPKLEDALMKLRLVLARTQARRSEAEFLRFRVRDPKWLRADDVLGVIGGEQTRLLKSGRVAWGALVEADDLLFSPGQEDGRATLLYSLDPWFDARPEALTQLAGTVLSFKNTRPEDPSMQLVAAFITDEMDRSMGWSLPTELSARPVRGAAFIVYRAHLPDGFLRGGVFPVLVHPDTEAVMILPREFWPAEILEYWQRQHAPRAR